VGQKSNVYGPLQGLDFFNAIANLDFLMLLALGNEPQIH